MATKETFTVEDGIAVQTKQLAQWKKLLKAKVYRDLEKWATSENHLKTSGFFVVRGTDLDNYVANYLVTQRAYL